MHQVWVTHKSMKELWGFPVGFVGVPASVPPGEIVLPQCTADHSCRPQNPGAHGHLKSGLCASVPGQPPPVHCHRCRGCLCQNFPEFRSWLSGVPSEWRPADLSSLSGVAPASPGGRVRENAGHRASPVFNSGLRGPECCHF